MRYKIWVYDHSIESYVASKLIEASSLSSAAKFAEIHFEALQNKKVDVTLNIAELKNDIKNNS